MRFSVSENPTVELSSSYPQICGILYFLPQDRSRVRVYLFVCLFFFFPRVNRIDPVVYNVVKGLILIEIKSYSTRLKWPKNWSAPRPSPTLIIFPKSTDQNSEIANLFSVVEKPINYVFGDDLLSHSPRGRGYKLQTLTSAYIK